MILSPLWMNISKRLTYFILLPSLSTASLWSTTLVNLLPSLCKLKIRFLNWKYGKSTLIRVPSPYGSSLLPLLLHPLSHYHLGLSLSIFWTGYSISVYGSYKNGISQSCLIGEYIISWEKYWYKNFSRSFFKASFVHMNKCT